MYFKVSLKSLPRLDIMPTVNCPLHNSASPLSTTVTVFKSVFAELGHCLLDPPARIPVVKQGKTFLFFPSSFFNEFLLIY